MPRPKKPATTDEPRPAPAPRKANGAAGGPMFDPDAIARRAYEIYQSRGGSDGADQDDWFEAERQLKTGPDGVSGRAPAKPRRRKTAGDTAP